jgi:spermidine/putrescine transport system substrate-binding protein
VRTGLAPSAQKERAVFALDKLVMHRSGHRPDLAYKFIEFWLQGKAPAELTNSIGAGAPNRVAMQWVEPAIADNRNLFPDPQQFKRLQILKHYDRKRRRLLNRL